MDEPVVVAIGTGLIVTGGCVCWSGWTSSNHLALFAGVFGLGMGAMMVWQERNYLLRK